MGNNIIIQKSLYCSSCLCFCLLLLLFDFESSSINYETLESELRVIVDDDVNIQLQSEQPSFQ